MLLFIVCLCFWSVRAPSPDAHSGEDYLRNTYGVQAPDAESGVPTTEADAGTLRKTKLDSGRS